MRQTQYVHGDREHMFIRAEPEKRASDHQVSRQVEGLFGFRDSQFLQLLFQVGRRLQVDDFQGELRGRQDQLDRLALGGGEGGSK